MATVICVAVAPLAVAFTPPKYTLLLAAVVEKLLPVIVIVLPAAPDVGVNELITGAIVGALCKIDMLLPPKFGTKISGLPSKSMS